MIINRTIYKRLKDQLQKGSVVVLYGPRQVGKTFLLNLLKEDLKSEEKILFLDGESRVVQERMSVQVPEQLKNYIGDVSLLIIDEAQRIPNVGINLKLIVDHFPDIKIVASGSSSFSLAQKVGEPLTGRKKTMHLFPVSAKEVIETESVNYYHSLFEHFLIFGGLPRLFSLEGRDEQIDYLNDFIDSYLLKDILEIEKVKGSKKLKDLLTLLAFQIGKEVSLTEIGTSLDLHKDTVYRYLDLMEQSFIIVNIRGFSRNLRKEVVKTSRYYFYDNGIRNALINNFNMPHMRNDMGELWENFIVMERIKKQAYTPIYANNYFWRTYDQKEVDWVEERDGKLYGYEIKWGNKPVKEPELWRQTYKEAEYEVINKDNYLDFIT